MMELKRTAGAPSQARLWRRYKGSTWAQPLAVIGIMLVGAWAFVVILAPWVAPYNPIAIPNNAAIFQPPSMQHLFGTDEVGRDVFSRVLWGARVSLPLAFILVSGLLSLGGTLGVIAGYFGGVIDGLIMRLADLVFAFPVILLAMAVTASLGPSLRNAVIAIVVVTWPTYARVVRGLVRSTAQQEFVTAARLLGVPTHRVLLIDVLPNSMGPVVVLAALDIGRAVLLLSALSFLGLGAQPPTAEWGSMVASGTQNMDRWWIGTFPGLAIFTVVLGFTFLGDTLRDVLDPKSAWSRN